MQNFKQLLFVVAIALCGILNAQDFPTTQWRDLADTSWYNTTDDSFDFSTPEQLAGLSQLVEEGNDFAGKTINIVADIDIDGHLWSPIGYNHDLPFSGNVEGNNHVVSNLWITGLNKDFLGLFGQSVNASFKNLNLDTANIDDVGTDSGSLVANLYTSTMENCHAYNIEIKVLGVNIGGLVGGVLTDGWVKNSSFSGNVTGVNQVGGLAGTIWDKAELIECTVEGSVTGEYIIGGIVGFTTMAFGPNRDGSVIDSYSRASVVATSEIGMAGGAVGYGQMNLIIKNTYSTGSVTALDAAGGFIGRMGFIVYENNYFDSEASGLLDGVGFIEGPSNPEGVLVKTTSEMKTQELADLLNAGNPNGPWAFDGVTNDGYPFLGEASMGVTDLTNATISIYPTVTSNLVYVNTENANSAYQIFNTAGSLVKTGKLNQNHSTIQISELASGVYILQIQSGNTTVSKKIIKK